jgi:cytochrome c peroxidase
MKIQKHIIIIIALLISSCTQNRVIDTITYQQELGHYLFFEKKLSINNTKSCASCHSPTFAFSDGYRTSVTSLGENVLHNSPSLINSIYLKKYDWANTNASSLEMQIKRPLYSNHPIELGLDKHINDLIVFFKGDSLYKALFRKAYPNSDTLFTLTQIENAIVAYEKTLISKSSQFDKGELSPSAYSGLKLFSSQKLNCISCHPPPYFTLATQTNNSDSIYENIGLYNVDGKNEYPQNDEGLSRITHQKNDNGKFKIPSLRNVMLTAPYMHDGSIASIEEVIDMYAMGGRNIDYGNYKGDGRLNANKNKLITGFTISKKEKMDLIKFLTSLTDSSIFYKQSFLNPFSRN